MPRGPRLDVLPLFVRKLRPSFSTPLMQWGIERRAIFRGDTVSEAFLPRTLRAGDEEVFRCLHMLKQLEAETFSILFSKKGTNITCHATDRLSNMNPGLRKPVRGFKKIQKLIREVHQPIQHRWPYRGPAKNPEPNDYVVAWIDHEPKQGCCPHFKPVSPKKEITAETGYELDYLIRRDLSAVKFIPLGSMRLCTLEYTPEMFRNSVDKGDWLRILARITCLFRALPPPN